MGYLIQSKRQGPSCNTWTYGKQICVRQGGLNRVLLANPSFHSLLAISGWWIRLKPKSRRPRWRAFVVHHIFCPGTGSEATNPNQRITIERYFLLFSQSLSRSKGFKNDDSFLNWPRCSKVTTAETNGKKLVCKQLYMVEDFSLYNIHFISLFFYSFLSVSPSCVRPGKLYIIYIKCCAPKTIKFIDQQKSGPYACPGMYSRRWKPAISSYLLSEVWLGIWPLLNQCAWNISYSEVLHSSLTQVVCFWFWAKGLSISQYLFWFWGVSVGILGSQVCALDRLRTRAKHVMDVSMETLARLQTQETICPAKTILWSCACLPKLI